MCVTSFFSLIFFSTFLVDVFLLFSLYLLLMHSFICLFGCVEINLMVVSMQQYWPTRATKSCSECVVRFGSVGLISCCVCWSIFCIVVFDSWRRRDGIMCHRTVRIDWMTHWMHLVECFNRLVISRSRSFKT